MKCPCTNCLVLPTCRNRTNVDCDKLYTYLNGSKGFTLYIDELSKIFNKECYCVSFYPLNYYKENIEIIFKKSTLRISNAKMSM